MKPTRLDTRKLEAAVAQAEKRLDEALRLLDPLLVALTDKERASVPRTLDGFPAAARAQARAIARHPNIAAASGFDAVAVVEDLNNVDALAALGDKVHALAQRIADSRLTWLGEAWVPSLAAYNMAKVAARTNGAMNTLVEPLAAIFSGRRTGKPKAAKAGDK